MALAAVAKYHERYDNILVRERIMVMLMMRMVCRPGISFTDLSVINSIQFGTNHVLLDHGDIHMNHHLGKKVLEGRGTCSFGGPIYYCPIILE